VVGEKIALSDYHLSVAPPPTFLAFFETRFLTSRYIFTLRNPVDVLLSSARLLKIGDDAGMVRLCVAWLDFMQMWADFIRVFPRTMTLLADQFGEHSVREMEEFTGLHLGDAHLLLDPRNKRKHKLSGRFPTLVRIRNELESIYASAVAAVGENKALWQAEQKRNPEAALVEGAKVESPSRVERPLGRVWRSVQSLRSELQSMLKDAASDR
jgi:hypothetical protein